METTLRIDKWLWFARLYKSRSLAASTIAAKEVWLNGAVVDRASHMVRVGDRLIFPNGRRWRAVTVLAMDDSRGPAVRAVLMYREDEMPPDHPVFD